MRKWKGFVLLLLAGLISVSSGDLMLSGRMQTAAVSASATETFKAEEGKIGPLQYRKYDTFVVISGCDPEAETVEIPEQIDGVPVMGIGEDAFYGCNLTSVTIPDSVLTIEYRAFAACKNLKEVHLPAQLSGIEFDAFKGCTALEEVTLPEDLVMIGTGAFANSGLKSINIPENVMNFGSSIFDNTPWLAEQVAKDPMVIFNHVLLDGRNCTGDVVIPDTVTEICMYAFSEAEITSVVIPDSVTTIGDSAFYGCTSLAEVTLPDSCTMIPEWCFEMTALRSIKLPSEVRNIGMGAFHNCAQLEEIVFPERQIDIRDDVFTGTPWLEARRKEDPLVIVNGTLIDGRTCEGDVVIPDTVTLMSPKAFEMNSAITSVIVPERVRIIWNDTFSYCQNLKNVEIRGAQFIGSQAFDGCFAVESFILPNTLIQIDSMAFHGWSGRIPITYRGTKEQWQAIEIADGNVSLKIADMTYAPYGDADADGELTVKDIVCLHKWIHNQPKNQIKNPDVVDINQDGTWDVFDLSLLKQAILKG